MQGTILFYENGRGIIRGTDQNRYDFNATDWMGSHPIAAGLIVDFMADGSLAHAVLALEVVSPLPINEPQPMVAPPDLTADLPDSVPRRLIYNIPATLAAVLLLVSLILTYAKLGYQEYHLTDGVLGGVYYVVVLALIGCIAFGLSWVGAGGGVVAVLFCSALALLGKGSLYADLSQVSQTARQSTSALGELGMGELGQAMQQATPRATDALTIGFYLHIAALVTLLYFVFIYRFEVRTAPLSLANLTPPRLPEPTRIAPPGPIQMPVARPVISPMSDTLFTSTSGSVGGSPLGSSLTVPVPSKEQTSLFMQSFLTFDKLIAPTLIAIAYYIGLGACLLTGAGALLNGLFGNGYGKGLQVMTGLGLLLLGPVMVRLWAEFFIVIFKIHTRLKSLDDKTKS